MSYNAHELSNRLLNALDSNYNVLNMQAVKEIISYLEKFNITKELLETTRLGKHVNELRRKTTDPTLSRRAKDLVKRWRDLVIPNVASPAHSSSNRSSTERTVRRHGGTPLTSPALARQVLSPAMPSPRPPSRPAWGGYESDSQDVILVDDDEPAGAPPVPPVPPAPPAPSVRPATAAPAPAPRRLPVPGPSAIPTHVTTPPMKRAAPIEDLTDDKTARKDKRHKNRKIRGRAGSGSEAGGGWGARNGAHERRNGCRQQDPYAALVKRMPKAGDKKVKTTKELLEEIQSRGTNKLVSVSPHSPRSPASPDVMLVGTELAPMKVESPLRNGESSSRVSSPVPGSPSVFPLEDPRQYGECTCGEDEEAAGECAGARRRPVSALHVHALHHALLPGLNGTRAPPLPHPFPVRTPADPVHPDLYASVVPLYKYSDYADDYCVKNLSRLPLFHSLPWDQFAPSPPRLPSPPPPPSPRPYPLDEPASSEDTQTVKVEPEQEPTFKIKPEEKPTMKVENVEPEEQLSKEIPRIKIEKLESEISGSDPELEERLKIPPLPMDDESTLKLEPVTRPPVDEPPNEFESERLEHRTVERTKEPELDGRALVALCQHARDVAAYSYSQADAAPIVTIPDDEAEARVALEGALEEAAADTERDALGRPVRAARFAEWHECARLGELVALPYVVID